MGLGRELRLQDRVHGGLCSGEEKPKLRRR
jgi:hypothetical protein